MMMHSQANTPQKVVAVGTSSNGFVGKTVQYAGKAGLMPSIRLMKE